MKSVSPVIVLPINKILTSLKREEGFRSHVYKDHLGHDTIGFGKLVSEGHGITEAEAEMLLRNDVARTIKEVRRNFGWFRDAPASIQSVVIEVAYQLGLPRLQKFHKMLNALSTGDYDRAANEIIDSRYYRQCRGRVTRYAERLRGK